MATTIVDDETMGSSGSDHEARFDRIFADHARAILAYCRRRASPADAHDALAEVFVVVWRRLDDVPETGTRPWLYGVARRVLANQRRTEGRRRRLIDVVRLIRPAAAPAAETVTMRRTRDEMVLDAVGRLPERDREVLTLVAWEGLSRAEVAAVVGCTPEAAKKRYQRAVERLRAELEAADTTPSLEPRSAPGGGD